MSFDQEIYRIQNEIQEQARRQETPVEDNVPSIYDEVTTLARLDYHFADRAFFDDALTLRIPEEFILLGQETMKRFLPASREGHLLLSDEEGLFTISLLKQSRTLAQKDLTKEKDKYWQVLPKLAAGVHIHAAKISRKTGKAVLNANDHKWQDNILGYGMCSAFCDPDNELVKRINSAQQNSNRYVRPSVKCMCHARTEDAWQNADK
ncbi:hypothetical protein SAMN05216582_12844 [Selenomonas ruminantium]|uniref:Uncharacterized protein n=1 Tax=Selenomonas ruminantium TaxID=971 RepID=A0A1M6WVX5_SELRU|nr:hypothetical protein [Selenomonas ruminantium]SHK97695.1 hypothetical protein SAMN05216582_12844 [Selenomonas ruminantium]